MCRVPTTPNGAATRQELSTGWFGPFDLIGDGRRDSCEVRTRLSRLRSRDSMHAVALVACSENPGISDRMSAQFAVLPSDVSDAGGLWYEVALEGVVIWERDLAVSQALARIRAAMADGRLRRSTIHGSPYWVRNFEPAHYEE